MSLKHSTELGQALLFAVFELVSEMQCPDALRSGSSVGHACILQAEHRRGRRTRVRRTFCFEQSLLRCFPSTLLTFSFGQKRSNQFDVFWIFDSLIMTFHNVSQIVYTFQKSGPFQFSFPLTVYENMYRIYKHSKSYFIED